MFYPTYWARVFGVLFSWSISRNLLDMEKTVHVPLGPKTAQNRFLWKYHIFCSIQRIEFGFSVFCSVDHSNNFYVENFCRKLFCGKFFCGKFFCRKIFLSKIFFVKNFFIGNFFCGTFFLWKFVLSKIGFVENLFCRIFFCRKFLICVSKSFVFASI